MEVTRKIGYSEDGWQLIEQEFSKDHLGKCEVIMAQGNGYMGIRSATEESYLLEKRDFFIAGTFNKAFNNEVTELPNLPDILEMTFHLNGERFDLTSGSLLAYKRTYDIRTGEVKRFLIWRHPKTGRVEMNFRRFASHDRLNLFAQEVAIKPLDQDLLIGLETGINGQVTNSGAQHFEEGERRFYDKKIMELCQRTSESHIDMTIQSGLNLSLEQVVIDYPWHIGMDRRRLTCQGTLKLEAGKELTLSKYTLVATTRDLVFEGKAFQAIREKIHLDLLDLLDQRYDALLKASRAAIEGKLWQNVHIEISSRDPWDQVAVRFALMHLHQMMPAHDSRMGIGAKGLTGEGYKGHSFWDTEVFMFPIFLYTNPLLARQLLEYRYKTLPGARKKAAENGFLGAQFPWESAWLTDGEVTPVWGAADILTGKSTKIWSGFIEQHITADITFAIYQYYSVTKDHDFMRRYGFEMMFETAKFWSSRFEEGEDGKLHINNVIGADEYKEHIDDNALTNYLVHLNLVLALKFAKELSNQDPKLMSYFNDQFNVLEAMTLWEEQIDRIYLPLPNDQGLIPQDSTYLTKKIIDLTKYKNQDQVGSLFKDYSLSQVNEMQVSKQADVMMLFYLREDLFSHEVKQANWDYYEPKTLHDSSLSLSTHAIIANDLGNHALAHDLYVRCRDIDLGPNMKSSDHGIHAASLGGLLQAVMNGFGGLRILNGQLRIEPKLPDAWTGLTYDCHFHGDTLRITVTPHEMTVINLTKKSEVIEFVHKNTSYLLTERITINLI